MGGQNKLTAYTIPAIVTSCAGVRRTTVLKDADCTLIKKVIADSCHVLHLPPLSSASQHYRARQRRH